MESDLSTRAHPKRGVHTVPDSQTHPTNTMSPEQLLIFTQEQVPPEETVEE